MSAPAAKDGQPNNKGLSENSQNSQSGSHDSPHAANSSSNKQSLGVEASLSALEKVPSNPSNLIVPLGGRRDRSQSVDTLSLFSNDDLHELRQVHSAVSEAGNQDEDGHSTIQDDDAVENRRLGWRGVIQRSWKNNKGLVWVILAQAFGVLMNVSTRLLEHNGNSMHPFEIIFVRMAFTSVLSMMYMYITKTPDFPLGAKGIRKALLLRGTGGFVGVFGIYWSLQYLPLADATVLTFMAPMISSAVCAKLLHEPYGRIEQIGCALSFVGVVLIAQPTALLSLGSSSDSFNPSSDSKAQSYNSTSSSILTRAHTTGSDVTNTQRLKAVGVAMLGVVGASCAYTSIRWIGKRAHPLISVNYFGMCATVASGIGLAFIPSISFVLPSTLKQWALLAAIAISGFTLQFLLTAGLRYEKSSRPQNMVYSQMLFALAADKIIWDDTPGVWSWAGSALILSSAIAIAMQKSRVDKSDEEHPIRDEEERVTGSGSDRGRRYGSVLEQSRHSTEAMIARPTDSTTDSRQSTESSTR